MKDFHKTVLVIFFFLAVIFLVSNKGLSTNNPPPRYITVTGDADVMVEPDEVLLSIGISTFNKDLKTAKEENEKRTKKVLQSIYKSGVEKKYIQTNHIRINPEYRSWTHSDKEGFYVYENIMITLKDIKKFEEVITSVLESGADQIYGIEFRTTQLRLYKDQARELALKAAQEKATEMAAVLNQKIGDPTSINESPTYWYYWYNQWWRGGFNYSMAQNVVQNISSGVGFSEDDSIAPGRIRVNAKVSVTFTLDK